MSSGKVILGVLVGAAAGLLAGLLIAPEKGSEMREKLSGMGEDYLDTVRDRFDDMLDNLTSKFDQIKRDVSQFSEKK